MLAELLSQHSQFDVAFVLISVTDNERVTLALLCDDSMELRLGASLKTEVELPAMADNLADDGLHLVDLYGIDDETLALEVILFGSLLIARRYFLNAVVKDVGEAQEHRWGDITQGKFIHDLAQVYLYIILYRGHIDMPFVINTKI